jgi:hypothetical protein
MQSIDIDGRPIDIPFTIHRVVGGGATFDQAGRLRAP